MIAPRRRSLPKIPSGLRLPAAGSLPAWAPAAACAALVGALLLVGAIVGGIRFDGIWAAGIFAAAAAGMAGAAALTIRLHRDRSEGGPARTAPPAGAEDLRAAAIERVLEAACELLPATRALAVRFRGEAIEAVALADGGALRTAAELGGVAPSPLAALVRRHGRVALLAPCPAAEVAVAVGLGVPPATARSIAWIPLSARGAMVGALCLTNDEPDGFSPDQAPTFRAVGALVGAALDALGVLDGPPPGEAADGITGLAGRRAFVERLGDLMASAGRRRAGLCLATMVLDELPPEAASSGHQAGDRLLREVAAALAGQLRGDDLLARSGVREFAVAFAGSDLTGAQALAARLRSALPPGASASIGIAAWRASERPEVLLRRSERALSEARRAGRDQLAIAQ